MRSDIDRSRNGYRPHYGRKPNIRLKRRNYHHDDNHYSRSRLPIKSRSYYHDDDYPSPSSNNRPPTSQLNNHDNHSTSSSRFDRDSYSILSTDQPVLSNEPPLIAYSPPTTRDRAVPSYYNDVERTRYPPPSSNYRSPLPSPSYRNDDNDYQSPTPFSHSHSNVYRSSDYSHRSERYNTAPNRNSLSRDHPPMASYPLRNQYTPVQEVDYRRRDYGRTTAMEHAHHSDRDHSRFHWNHDTRSTRTIRR